MKDIDVIDIVKDMWKEKYPDSPQGFDKGEYLQCAAYVADELLSADYKQKERVKTRKLDVGYTDIIYDLTTKSGDHFSYHITFGPHRDWGLKRCPWAFRIESSENSINLKDLVETHAKNFMQDYQTYERQLR